jgi:hypothetical protein
MARTSERSGIAAPSLGPRPFREPPPALPDPYLAFWAAYRRRVRTGRLLVVGTCLAAAMSFVLARTLFWPLFLAYAVASVCFGWPFGMSKAEADGRHLLQR